MLLHSAHRKRPRSSSEDPAPPSTPMSTLPMDLIVAILDLLPLPARLVVCSLVCKRWRAAAARTIRRLEISRNCKPSVSAYPCVTDLNCRLQDSDDKEIVALPQTLRKLTLAYYRTMRLGQMFDVRLPTERAPDSLACLNVHYNVSLQSFLPWLYQLSTSLTKISFSLPLSEATPAEREFLRQAHLTGLTHLSFYFTASVDTDLMLDFLHRHSAQLLALELYVIDANARAMAAPPHQAFTFPVLRKLFLSKLPCSLVRELIEGCPLLQRLTLYCKFEHDRVLLRIPRVQATLISVDVPNWDDELKPLLELCPHLRYVPLGLGDRRLTASVMLRLRLATCLNGLHGLLLAIGRRRMSQLHELTIAIYSSKKELPNELIDLPYLSKLRVECGSSVPRIGLSEAVEQVRYLVRSAPRLRHIHLSASLRKLTVYGVDQMLKFLHDMAARGIEEVHLGDSVESPRLKATAKSFTWMRVKLGRTERECEATEGVTGAWEHGNTDHRES